MQQTIETVTKRTDGRYMGRFIVDHKTNHSSGGLHGMAQCNCEPCEGIYLCKL